MICTKSFHAKRKNETINKNKLYFGENKKAQLLLSIEPNIFHIPKTKQKTETHVILWVIAGELSENRCGTGRPELVQGMAMMKNYEKSISTWKFISLSIFP